MDERKPTKRGRGRPQRAPGESLDRVALNLRSTTLFGLELLARDRRTSLSQAAEFALVSLFREYLIDGKPLGKWLEAIELVETSPDLAVHAFRGPDMPDDKKREIIHNFYTLTGYARIQIIPPNLRSAEEKYLFDVLQVEGPRDLTQGALLMDLVKQGFKNGLAPEEVAKSWQQHCAAAGAPGNDWSR